jgi:FAD/FMN-containing dehydrogenase
MRDEIIALTPSRKEWQGMHTPDQGAGPDTETSPGVGRRRFLSAGGGLAAGAGALTLGRPGQGSSAVTLTAPPATRALRPIYPADPRYATLRMGFNRRWVGSPAYIQLVSNARQTVQAVQRAHDAGLRITVRSGGHCYENFVSGNHGGVIIDLSGMQGVYLDPAGRVCVEAGATMWNVYETLFKDYNLTLPGGSCYSVGMGGHIVGGGYGLLSRLQGLTVDYLTAVDVVCVDRRGRARLVRARKGDPETGRLLWAHTGGGGGNFGIVTAYYFSRLPSPPPQVQAAITTWQWKDLTAARFATLLRNFGRFMQANSSPSSPFAGLFALIHAFHRSAERISMTTQAAGPAIGLLQAFLDQITAGVPGTTTSILLPWLQATQTFNGSGRNQRGKYKSAYMKAPFPEDQIQAIHSALTDPNFNNPQALLQIDSYGCRINALAPDATAVPQRSSIMKLQYQTYWPKPEDDQVNLRWINDFYASVYSATGGVPVSNRVTDGCFINYPDVDLPPSWPTLYYKDSYPALQAVKARWDPRNVFNHAQSIVPATHHS